MIMCDFSALGPVRRKALLETFSRLLEPGGAVLLDAYTMNEFAKREESAAYEKDHLGGFWPASPHYTFVNTFKYEDERVLLDKYTVIENDRTQTLYNWFQCFTPESLTSEVEEAGLEVETVLANVAGDDYDPSADELAMVARKPG